MRDNSEQDNLDTDDSPRFTYPTSVESNITHIYIKHFYIHCNFEINTLKFIILFSNNNI